MRLYTIGKIVSTHGLKGEVKVYPETSFPERFLEMERVLLGDESYQDVYVIESARIQKNAVI
ncbi:MAG TPA: 16S rRNA processing protein RimM, partial [Bacillota bacterium]|nr:16S rRNA processing protein RimM [Bacillota bacterium]